jgi:hypothetical protein
VHKLKGFWLQTVEFLSREMQRNLLYPSGAHVLALKHEAAPPQLKEEAAERRPRSLCALDIISPQEDHGGGLQAMHARLEGPPPDGTASRQQSLDTTSVKKRNDMVLSNNH